MTEPLETVLADAKSELPVMDRTRGVWTAKDVEKFVERVEQATFNYRTFVTEKAAAARSGKSTAWFRARFAAWEREGNARLNPTNPRERQYRLMIVPLAARTSEARADAVRTARGEQ
jgi:hypothetical protein